MGHERLRLRGRRGRLALRLTLLAPPVLFWLVVFAVLAGVRPRHRLVAVIPDAAQALVALACPLVAAVLVAAALNDEGCARRVGGAALGRLTVAAGAALFAFAVFASLGPA